MTAKKCKNRPCSCIAAEGRDYCSQACQDSKNATELVCQCGHAGCGDAPRPAKAG